MLKSEAPWYSDRLRSTKINSLMVHFEIYRELCTNLYTIIGEKGCFYPIEIEECGRDQKKLFKLTSNLMGSNANVNFPVYVH